MAIFQSDSESTSVTPEDLRWWKYKDSPDDLARACFAAASAMIENNGNREEIIWRNIRMYSGQTRDSYWGETAQNPLSLNRGTGNQTSRVNRNVVASVADTMVAMLSSTEIKTTVLSDGGDYSRTQKKSKLAEKYCNGVKYNNRFHLRAPEALLSACVCDLGIVKIYEDEDFPGDIKIENVFPAEIIVDEMDGLHKEPRQIMQRKVVAREVVKELYPDVPEDRLDAITAIGNGINTSAIADKIEVLEAWHLPSGPDAEDGLHVVSLENYVLYQEQWTAHHFPFAFLRPNLNMFGFWGMGVVSDLVGVQYEINALSAAKQRALMLGSNFMVLVPTGSKLNKNHLLNGMGLILEYTGEKPDWFTPSPVSPQIDTEITGLIGWSYQRWGVSQLTAQSLKPDGLDSGQALRTYANIQSVRHSTLGKAYQQFHLDVDEIILLTARQIDERRRLEHEKAKKSGKKHTHKKLEVRVPDAKHIERIKWEDADPGDGFIVKLYPTNLFADSPADRLAQVSDLAQKNIIDPDTFLDVMPYPDLEVLRRIRNAPRENILKQIDDILIDGKYRQPEPFQNLQLGCVLMQSALLDAETRGDITDDKMRMLQRWIGEAKKMLAPPPPPPPPPAPLGAGPGMMPPMPPPGGPPPPMAPMMPGPPQPMPQPIPQQP